MPKILLALLAALPIFGADVKQESYNYYTYGTSANFKKVKKHQMLPNIQIGFGTRLIGEHGIDIAQCISLNPNFIVSSTEASYFYANEKLKGFYFGPTASTNWNLYDMDAGVLSTIEFNLKGTAGYLWNAGDFHKFVQLQVDKHLNLIVRSGIAF